MDLTERIELFDGLTRDIVSPEFREWLTYNGYFHAPASTKFHGNYYGGLFDHSFQVAASLVELTKSNNLRWERAESPIIIGFFHDLCKIDSYRHPVSGDLFEGNLEVGHTYDKRKWEFNPDTELKGHGDKSVMLLASKMLLTEEEVMCIRYHMGAFTDKEEWSLYTRAVNKYSNVLWTHHADMIASHILGI